MANMTLAIPDDLHKKMKQHKEISWSEVARQAFKRKIATADALARMDHILRNSELTKKDIEELSSKIKREMYEDMKKYSST